MVARVPAVISEHRYDLVAPPDAAASVLVLHPHPDMGGDRFNPVVDAVFRAAVDRGWAALRFDFSTSDVDEATAEAAEAVDLLPTGPRPSVVGYSFGAAIAAGLADERIAGWALIAPPFGPRFPAADLAIGPDPRPKLLLSPAHDQFCPPEAAAAATSSWVNATVEPVASADHFMSGVVDGVANRVLDWIGAMA